MVIAIVRKTKPSDRYDYDYDALTTALTSTNWFSPGFNVACFYDYDYDASMNYPLFTDCSIFYLKYGPAAASPDAGSLATDHMTTEGRFLSRRTNSAMTSK